MKFNIFSFKDRGEESRREKESYTNRTKIYFKSLDLFSPLKDILYVSPLRDYIRIHPVKDSELLKCRLGFPWARRIRMLPAMFILERTSG